MTIPFRVWHRVAGGLAGALCATVLAVHAGASTPVSPGRQIGPDTLDLDSSYAIHSCAPDDGEAVALYFGARVIGPPGAPERIEHQSVEIAIWQPWSSLAGRTFTLQDYHGGGFASYCPRDGRSCERLEYARVHFDQVTDDRLKGRIEVLVAGGRRIARRFSARLVPIRMMCG